MSAYLLLRNNYLRAGHFVRFLGRGVRNANTTNHLADQADFIGIHDVAGIAYDELAFGNLAKRE